MVIMRGTDLRFEVLDGREVKLTSDDFEECQRFIADNTEGLVYSEVYGGVFTPSALKRGGCL